MKKQITFEIGEKPAFTNEVEIKQTLVFLAKLEQAVKLYDKHSKALKKYMLDNGIDDIKIGEFNAHISTGTARTTDDNDKLNEFLKSIGHDRSEFKKIGNPPKSLEIYRD